MRHAHRICTIVLAVCSTTSVLADGVMLNGVSPTAIGRGGTNLGFADNGAVWFDNPAAAVNVEKSFLVDVGVDVLITDFDYTDPQNPSANDTTGTPLPQIGVVHRSEDRSWAYGIGLYVPAGFTETYNLQGPFPLLGERPYKSFGALARIPAGIAYRVTDYFSVGATVGLGISHAELEGPYFLQSPGPLQGTPTLLDLQATGATFVWSVGAQLQVTDRTTLGVSFLSESRFEMDGKTAITVPLLGSSRYETELAVTWPRTLGAGLRHELTRRDTLGLDVIWFNWADAFDTFGIRLTDPSNPFFPALREEFPLRWDNSVSLRLGYERKLSNGNVLRLGYVHHPNPIPAGTLTPYIQATLENGFSIGYGWGWKRFWTDVSYMYMFGDGDKERVNQSQFVGGDFNNATHRAQTHAVTVSFQWGS